MCQLVSQRIMSNEMKSLPNLKKLLCIVGLYSKNNRLWYKIYGLLACTSMWILIMPTVRFSEESKFDTIKRNPNTDINFYR